ncbi:MAG TPA: MFS transporter [Candidatus Hodarchaeales archaeon]|nr:MFS transporter [Candidatus Hodarchaeales archaeon]
MSVGNTHEGEITVIRRRNPLRVLLLILGIGILFTAVSLGVYFDSSRVTAYLSQLYENLGFPSNESSNLAGLTANFIRALNVLFYLITLIVAGALSDNFRSKFGNRMPVILLGGTISFLAYVIGAVLFSVPILGEYSPLIFGLLVYVGVAIGFACIVAPASALVSDLFSTQERAWVAMGTAFLSSMGTFIGVGLAGFSDFLFLQIVGVLVLSLSLASFLIIPKKNPDIPPVPSLLKEIISAPKYLLSVGASQGGGGGNRSFTVMFLVQTCWGVAAFIILGNFASFILEINKQGYQLGINKDTGLVLLGITGLLFAAPAGIIINRFGKTRSAMIGSLMMGFATFAMAQEVFWSFFGILIVISLAGAATILITTVSVALPADIAPKGKAGLFMGLFVFAYNFLNPIVGILSSYLFLATPDPLAPYATLFLVVTIFEFIAMGLLTFIHYEDVVEGEYVLMRRRYSQMRYAMRGFRFRRSK